MPQYIVRFFAKSCVRLNRKSYFDPADVPTVTLVGLGHTTVVFDRFVDVSGVDMPNGLIIQVDLESATIDDAVQKAGAFASGALNILTLTSAAVADEPYLLFAYDASPSSTDRDFISVSYDRTSPPSTRRPNDPDLAEFIRAYDAFHTDAAIKDDFKNRVSRGVDAYRRALSQNDDPLTDFVVLWASLEGMDKVYRKTFPTRKAEFKDGMRDVFARLGEGGVFDTLEGLRNDIAHGDLDVNSANQLALANSELTRKAVLFMVLRIIKCDEVCRNRLLALKAYKGSFVTRLTLRTTAQFQPGSVNSVLGHPQLEAQLESLSVTPNGDKVDLQPRWNIVKSNLVSHGDLAVALHGDSGANVNVTGMGFATETSAS